MILRDFAIEPGALDPRSHDSEDNYHERLASLAHGLQPDGFVRDLFARGWRKTIQKASEKEAQVFLTKLEGEKRLIAWPIAGRSGRPKDDAAWAAEALAGDPDGELQGVISARKGVNESEGFIPIHRLARCARWTADRRTLEVPRRAEQMTSVLRPLLERADSVVLIDPYLSKLDASYDHVREWVRINRKHKSKSSWEIHSVARSGRSRGSLANLEERFQSFFCTAARVPISVYLWEGFHIHDRFLLTGPVNLQASNSFDVVERHGDPLRLTKLSTRARDQVTARFGNRNSMELNFVYGFTIQSDNSQQPR